MHGANTGTLAQIRVRWPRDRPGSGPRGSTRSSAIADRDSEALEKVSGHFEGPGANRYAAGARADLSGIMTRFHPGDTISVAW